MCEKNYDKASFEDAKVEFFEIFVQDIITSSNGDENEGMWDPQD